MAEIKPVSELSECPYCGHDEFYEKRRYSGTGIYFSKFNEDDADNSDMYENVNYTLRSKFAYCADCKRKIGIL